MTEDFEENALAEILPDELFTHPDYCHSQSYWRWEKDVAMPELQKAGFEVGSWFSTDADSFGPLVRAVRLTKDGITKTYTYG